MAAERPTPAPKVNKSPPKPVCDGCYCRFCLCGPGIRFGLVEVDRETRIEWYGR